jgi:Family of unknown function (DUF6069)
MTATVTDTRSTTTTGAHRALVVPGIAAGVTAAAATTTVAAIARAAGVALAAEGEQIPLLGFAQLTFLFSMVGVVLAAMLRRRAARPRRTFVRTTVTLAAISLAAPFTLPMDGVSIGVLVLAHVVAAAIVIPAVAGRLR